MTNVTTGQVKAARALLGWSQGDLAGASGVSHPTIKRLEAQWGALRGRDETALLIIRALEKAGVVFTNGGEPGVKLRRGAHMIADLNASNDE